MTLDRRANEPRTIIDAARGQDPIDNPPASIAEIRARVEVARVEHRDGPPHKPEECSICASGQGWCGPGLDPESRLPLGLPPLVSEARARAEKATKAPWLSVRGNLDTYTVKSKEPAGLFTVAELRSWDSTPENSEFIAHARTDIPDLCNLVEGLAGDKAQLAAEVARLKALVRAKDDQISCLVERGQW